MSDSQERNQQATPKRLREAYSKGQIGNSRDLIGWLAVAAAATTLPIVAGSVTQAVQELFAVVKRAIANPSAELATQVLAQGLGTIIPSITPMFAAVLIATLVGAAVQGGIHFKSLTPSFKNFDFVAGSKRVFGTQGLWEGAKALMKTIVVGVVLYSVLQGLIPVLMNGGGLSVTTIIAEATGGIGSLLQSAIVAGLALAALDVFVVMRRNRKHTRMTMKELKDENKNSEGDPLVRSQRRSRQLSMSRNRMIAAVASADVVMLNPTHVAVALVYEPGKSAPRVVAKGSGEIAARIREKAAEGRVPMVRDVPLARALFAACEVGQEIPVELYTAVARVLAFVSALKARGAAFGVHQLAPAPALA